MNDNNIIDIDKFRAAQNSLRASETSPRIGRSAGYDIASSGVPSTRERRKKEQNADQVPNDEGSKPIKIKKSGKLLNAAMIDILKWLRPEQCREYPIAQRVQSEDSPPYLLQPSSKREPYLPANKPRSVFRAKAPRKGRRLSKRRVSKGRSNATTADERVSIPLLLAQNIRCHCLPPERVIPTPHQREIAPHLQVIYTPLQCAQTHNVAIGDKLDLDISHPWCRSTGTVLARKRGDYVGRLNISSIHYQHPVYSVMTRGVQAWAIVTEKRCYRDDDPKYKKHAVKPLLTKLVLDVYVNVVGMLESDKYL